MLNKKSAWRLVYLINESLQHLGFFCNEGSKRVSSPFPERENGAYHMYYQTDLSVVDFFQDVDNWNYFSSAPLF